MIVTPTWSLDDRALPALWKPGRHGGQRVWRRDGGERGGAGQGIGRAIAEAFMREGATVWATDADAAKLEGLRRAKRRKLNVLSTRAVDAFAAKVGGIDVLGNCAGFVHHGTVLDCSEKDWDFSFDLNVKSMHRTIKAFLPGMLQRGGGAIVNIASGASSVRGIPN